MITHCSDYSTELAKPVAWDFVSFEHFLSKFLVASIFDCVNLKSVGVGVDVMIFSEHVAHRVECGNASYNHQADYFSIRDLAS